MTAEPQTHPPFSGRLKPPVPYFGSKQRIAQRIVSLFPPHSTYVEPFAGSLSVLLAKPPARIEVVSDLDEALVTFWRVLRDRPHELARACWLTPHSRAEFEVASRHEPGVDDLEVARRVWVELTQGRSAHRRRTGWKLYRDAGATRLSMPDYRDAYARRLLPAAERLRTVSLECRPALELVRDYGQEPKALLYVDPPYLASTRRETRYLHEMATAAEHEQLADALHSCRAAVALSGYRSPLYASLYPDWTCYEIAAATDSVTDPHRVEVLWVNRVEEHLFSPDPARSPLGEGRPD